MALLQGELSEDLTKQLLNATDFLGPPSRANEELGPDGKSFPRTDCPNYPNCTSRYWGTPVKIRALVEMKKLLVLLKKRALC